MWETSTIGDEFSVQLGKRVDAAVARGVPKLCINNRSVGWGHVDPSVAAVELLTETDIRELRLAEGDVLVCEGGEIGRSSVWRGERPEAYYLNTLHRLRSKNGYEPALAAAFLEYFVSTGALKAIVGKSSLAHLTKENLLRVPLPVPPRREQKAIATALRSVDDLTVSLERLIAKKRDVKQGIMQELLTGRIRLPGFTRAWTETVLREVLKFQPGFPFAASHFTNSPFGMRLVRNRDLRSDESKVYYEGSFPPQFLLSAGDVLIGMDGDFDPVIWRQDGALLNQRVGRLLLSKHVDGNFLAYALQAPLNEIQNDTGATTVKHLSHSDVESISLMLPPESEQSAIAEVLQNVDAEIEALERRLESTRAVKVGMMQELLTGRTRLPVEEDT